MKTKQQKKSYAELYQLFADHEDILSEFHDMVYREGLFSGFNAGAITASCMFCAYGLLQLRRINKINKAKNS